MLTSITPLGERGKGNRWAVTASAYAAGSVLGGATVGLLLGGLGSLLPGPGTVALLLAAGACALALVSDLPRPAWSLPSTGRQVDEDWLTRYRGWVYGVGYGAQLGFGAVTIVTSASTYAAAALALLTGSPWSGLAVGLTFGLVRALPILTVRSTDSPERLRLAARTLQDLATTARRWVVAVLTAATGTLLLTALS